jgi:hypothetical protein
LTIRTWHLVVGALAGALVALGSGYLFPRFAPESIAEEAAKLQSIGQRVQGGSTYMLGTAAGQTGVAQVVLIPFAVLTALFRPLIFEATSPLLAASAMETTVLAAMFLLAIWRRGVIGALRATLARPALVFCTLYVVGISVGVGLATTNLGSLARYRTPMMPFLALLATILAMRPAQPQHNRVLLAPARPRTP